MAEMKTKWQAIKEIGETNCDVYKRRRAEAIRGREFHFADDRKFGQIDILVNNAGGSGGFAPVSDLSDEALEMQQHGYFTNLWATRASQNMLKEVGAIINIERWWYMLTKKTSLTI